jgi:DNA-binding MarR family transcriptional regulator
MAGLSQSPERALRMSRLAEFAEGQLPRLSQVVARLEKRGWITRHADPRTAAPLWPPSPTRGWRK